MPNAQMPNDGTMYDPAPPPSLSIEHSSVGHSVRDAAIIDRILLDAMGPGSDQAFSNRVRAFVAQASDQGLVQALSQAGLTGDALTNALRELLRSPDLAAAIRSDTVRIATRVDEFTRKLVRNQIAEGMDAGEDIRHLADRVQGVMQNRRTDALRIARNSVGQANSQAQYVARRSYATHEIWIHSRGPGERRASHVEAEARYRAAPKPVGQPFIVHGVPLRFPRDPAGPPSEIINCQCLALGKYVAGSRPERSALLAESLAIGWASARAVQHVVHAANGGQQRRAAGPHPVNSVAAPGIERPADAAKATPAAAPPAAAPPAVPGESHGD